MVDGVGLPVRELPFRGELAELAIIGNGRSSVLRVIVPDGRAFGMALRCARSHVRTCPGVIVTTCGGGDAALDIRFRPAPRWELAVDRFTLHYPGSDEDWKRDCAVWMQMTRSLWPPVGMWAVEGVYVELVARSTASEPSGRPPAGTAMPTERLRLVCADDSLFPARSASAVRADADRPGPWGGERGGVAPPFP